MSISVADNFSYQGTKPLDARFQFSSVANMKAAAEATLYNGCLAYVTATKTYYTYDSSNSVDSTTGRWRELIVFFTLFPSFWHETFLKSSII